ncbi:MAG: aspartate 1-decarboxylase [Bacteroidia bacterium]|nr:aspartate 1-decarboxylase [Bacteroidia bacterium]
MIIEVLKSKIHRAKVTQTELHYVGSITIDKALMRAANIIPYEKVQVVNVNNGARFETYVIEGEENSGIICLNGATARLCLPGDILIIMSYAQMDFEQAKTFIPSVVFPDAQNRLV